MAPTRDPDSGFVEGHAHLYVNGTKVQRVYDRDIHLPASLFQAGVNQISVTLNNHGHMHWTQDGRQLIATLFINPQAAQAVIYRFESFPVPQQDESS